jgi:hypothetical protein
MKRYFLVIFYTMGGWFTWVAVGTAAATMVGGMLNKSKAPATAQYTPVNPSQVEGQTINADLSNQGSAQQLSSSSNAFNSSQAMQMLNTALPGYSGLSSSLMGQAQSLAANPYAVPKSVTDQLTQYAAENNITAGTGAASGFSGSNMLRSLGINALQYGQTNMQTAMSALSTLTGTAPQVSPTSPLSFMLSPNSVLQTQTQNNMMQQNIAQGANNAQAAASNANSNNLWDTITSQLPGLISAAGGALGGTDGSGGQGTSAGAGGSYSLAAANGGWAF